MTARVQTPPRHRGLLPMLPLQVKYQPRLQANGDELESRLLMTWDTMIARPSPSIPNSMGRTPRIPCPPIEQPRCIPRPQRRLAPKVVKVQRTHTAKMPRLGKSASGPLGSQLVMSKNGKISSSKGMRFSAMFHHQSLSSNRRIFQSR